jgi:Glycosyl transferase family 11
MLILAAKSGQLANRLFLFSHLIAAAIEHDLTLANLAFQEYAPFFESTCQDWLCRYPSHADRRPSPSLRQFSYILARGLTLLLAKANFKTPVLSAIDLSDDQNCDLNSPEFVQLAHQVQFLFLKGWLFRNHSNVLKHASQIRQYFTPVEPHRSHVNDLITSIRQSCDVLIGVHIRQGDYAHFMDGKHFHTTPQYVQVMKKVQVLFPDQQVTFLICSNVPQQSQDFFPCSIAFANNHLLEDLYSLAQCDYIIGAVSTYSLWASFHGQVPLYHIQNLEAEVSIADFRVSGG